jgi:hypothetical protein
LDSAESYPRHFDRNVVEREVTVERGDRAADGLGDALLHGRHGASIRSRMRFLRARRYGVNR